MRSRRVIPLMRACAAVLPAMLVAVTTTSAQQPLNVPDAVSIARVETWSPRSGLQVQPGRFTMENMLLGSLIQFAYEGEVDELRGAPPWALRDRYNVSAVVSGAERTDVAAAMRVLLRDRLGFSAHLEAKREDVLTLMRILPDRPLIGLRKIDIDCADAASGATGTSISRDGIVPPCVTHSGRVVGSGGESMARFAGFVSAIIGSKVVDKIGLDGYYAYTLKYSPDFPGAEPPTPEYPRIRSALRQQLGLMVRRRTLVTRVLVIDHLERPAEN